MTLTFGGFPVISVYNTSSSCLLNLVITDAKGGGGGGMGVGGIIVCFVIIAAML